MARNFVAANSDYLSRSGAILSAFPFTFACWATARASGNIFTLGNTGSDSHYIRLATGTDVLGFTVANVAQGYIHYSSPAPGVLSGDWRHMAITAASSTDRKTYYAGASIGANSNPATWPVGLDVTAIGCLHRTTRSGFHDGSIAHAAFWSVVLTAGEVASLAAGASPLQIRPESLAAYWPLRGLACDRPEPAVTSSGRDLTVFGTSWAEDPRRIWSPMQPVHGGQPWYAAAAAQVVAPSTSGRRPRWYPGLGRRRRRA